MSTASVQVKINDSMCYSGTISSVESGSFI